MRILFLRSNPVSPDPRVEKEVNSLLKQGHQIEIFAWDRHDDHACCEGKLELSAGNAKIFRVGIKAQFSGGIKKNLVSLCKFQWQILSFIRKRQGMYDVIHACDFDTGFAAAMVLPRGRRFVYDIFDYYVDGYKVPGVFHTMIAKMENWVIKKADVTIICTEERMKQIDGSKSKKVVVLHNSPDRLIPNDHFKLRGSQQRIRIAYVGILGSGRHLLQMCEFVGQHPEFELHIGGFGAYEDRIRQFEEKYENVFFYGKLNYSDAITLESQCDIIPALYDPKRRNHQYAAPNKFYEALYLGKPSVMADGTGMSAVVAKEDVGAVVEYEQFAQGFLQLAQRKAEWPMMAERARKLYDDSYSWQKMERRLYELYDAFADKA